jgi:hypothetical protein
MQLLAQSCSTDCNYRARFQLCRSLVSLPLWGWNSNVLLASFLLIRDGAGELGKSALVGSHGDSNVLEGTKLSSKTNSSGVDVHVLAIPALDLVDLKGTSILHGNLDPAHEVVAQAHWPARLDLAQDSDVLVHEAIDLGHRAIDLYSVGGEQQAHLTVAETLAFALSGVDIGDVSNGREEVANRAQDAALALLDNIIKLIGSRRAVRLQGQVVVGDLAAVALDSGEHVVSHGLHTGSNGSEKCLL